MAVDSYDIFSPCAILYPFSLTAASTSSKKIHEWFIYRLYTLLIYIVVVGSLVTQVYIYIIVDNMPWTIINKPSLLTLYAVHFTILLVQSLIGAKKNKLEKIMDEINEIDDESYSINDRKYKIYNAVFATILLINHIGTTIINILTAEGTMLFSISLSFINIVSDAEILVISSFVSILNAKMAHLVVKLEHIVKNKESSKEELYERYRQGLHILKRINSVWQGRIFLIIIFQLYFMTRTVLKIFAREQTFNDAMSAFTVISKYMMSIRHIVMYSQLGVLGQWLAETFDQIKQLAFVINDMDIEDELSHQTMKISRLAAVCPGRLCAGSLIIDGNLPLRAIAAVISTVILMLQFGISAY